AEVVRQGFVVSLGDRDATQEQEQEDSGEERGTGTHRKAPPRGTEPVPATVTVADHLAALERPSRILCSTKEFVNYKPILSPVRTKGIARHRAAIPPAACRTDAPNADAARHEGGAPNPEKRPWTMTRSPSATITLGSYLSVAGRPRTRVNRPSRPGAMWALCWM